MILVSNIWEQGLRRCYAVIARSGRVLIDSKYFVTFNGRGLLLPNGGVFPPRAVGWNDLLGRAALTAISRDRLASFLL
jgi:hypothetical protein